MPKITSLEDLKKIKDQAQQKMSVRLATGTTITVGMGTCGIAAGARETMHAILKELQKREIDAHVVTVGCIGLCAGEPLVDIEQAGCGRISYGKITADRVPELIESHLVKNQIVQEWIVGRVNS
jgi:NADP-reducing hydrogenase subunit HndB